MKGEDQNIDRAFFHCLKEIELSYTTLPKMIRLRIEKWVEKFITVGFNVVWKKNRNMYAKLLLSMIISKSLSDPFHCSPAEGDPLPPFPSYLIPKFKSALGPHESYFWRNIFDRVHEPALHTFTPPPPTPSEEPVGPARRDFSSAPSPSYVKLDPSQKETYNLRLLMKEQSRRIELMEEQMQQERLVHQRDIQHVLQQAQEETGRIKSMYRSGLNHSNSRNDTITSSNPYEIYDGNVTYGRSSPRKWGGQRPFDASVLPTKHDRGQPNTFFSRQDLRNHQLANNHDAYAAGSKYHHRQPNRDASFDHCSSNAQDYSVGVPVFTPGKEEKTHQYSRAPSDSSSQQKSQLSSSKSVNFDDIKHDIKPISFDLPSSDQYGSSGRREAKDIFPPSAQYSHQYGGGARDVVPHLPYAPHSPQRSRSPDISALGGGRFSQSATPEKGRAPSYQPSFSGDHSWAEHQRGESASSKERSPTTYERAKGVVNKLDSNVDVVPVLKKNVPEDEGEFVTYLEDFQKKIRHLQSNTSRNKGA